jgi:hypothetical protein
MATRFLIEVPHDASPEACARAASVFLPTGSHFLSRADWGCKDGEHKAWIVVEVDSRDDALGRIPPAFRERAKVIQQKGLSQERHAQLAGLLRNYVGDVERGVRNPSLDDIP